MLQPRPMAKKKRVELRNVPNSMRGKVLKWAKTIPTKWRNTYFRSYKGSKTAAIKSTCQSCIGFEDVRRQIKTCGEKGCALYSWRPYSNSKPVPITLEGVPTSKRRLVSCAHKSRPAAIKLKCMQCMGGVDAPKVPALIRECATVACPLWPHRPYQF